MPAFLKRCFAALLALPLLCVPLRAADGDDHLFLGNPSGAVTDHTKPDNYLLKKRQYALSYNSSKGNSNWVSWQLNKGWLGRTTRGNPFAPDLSLPAGFQVVRPNDYRGSGLDRGHMCPAADRSCTKEDMDATFVMSNMVPQAPDLNRITWEKLEAYCREQVRERDVDLYVSAGPAGRGGTGSDGPRTYLRGAKGRIVVPKSCWKVVLAVPAGTADPGKVTAAEARVFSVIMPNVQGLDTDWRSFAVPAKDVEELTGFSFFSNLPPAVAEDLRARKPETRARAEKTEPKKVVVKKKGGKGKEEVETLPAFKEGCVIANKATKKYHVPGGRYYESSKTSKNAVFFKNSKDAEAAGYTASKR
jgi:endonuclease G